MDWLSSFYAVFDYDKKRVDSKIAGESEFSLLGSDSMSLPRVVFVLQAQKLLLNGCSGFLAIMVK